MNQGGRSFLAAAKKLLPSQLSLNNYERALNSNRKSNKTIATKASTIGTALGTTQGS